MTNWRKVARAIKFPSLIPPEFDKYLGKVRAKYEFDTNAQVSLLARIRPPDKINIGASTVIKPYTVLKPKGNSGISIGNNSTLHQFSYISGEISIGSSVRIASSVHIYSYDHSVEPGTKIRNQPLEMGHVEIGDDVWIGTSATVLKDVSVGYGAVIGAGSVVTQDIPPKTIVAGNPAKKIGER